MKTYMIIHTENGTPPRHLRNEILPFAAARMNLDMNILSEVDRKRKTVFLGYHPYMESKRNISMKQEETHNIENRLVVAKEVRTVGLG